MIRFRKWREHNSRALKDVDAKRVARGVKVDAPLSMQKVLIVTHLDGQFAAFAQIVGGAVAETYFLRAMQYAAEHDGRDGSIDVPREKFGPITLSRPWHLVSRSAGEKAYDALLASRICVISEPVSAFLSADKSEDTSADWSVDMSLPPPPTPSPSPTPKPPNPLSDGGWLASPPDDNDPLTAQDLAQVQAMAQVLANGKHTATQKRTAALALDELAAGTIKPQTARLYIRQNLADTNARVAGLAARKAVLG